MKAASALVALSAEIDVSLPSSVALLKTATAFLGTADLQQLLRVCETLRPLEAGGDQNAAMDVNVDGDDSDVDAIFAMPRVPHGVAYRHAMLRLLGIAGSAVAVSSGQTQAQHAAFVGQLRDMHAWIRRTQASGDSRTASAAIEPLVQWIVRTFLETARIWSHISAKPQTPHPLPLIQVCKKDLGDLIAFLMSEPHRLQAPHMPASLDGRSIIVSWSHQQLPAIARYLGAPCELVPDKWQGPRFDVTWVVEMDEGQEPTFRQMPQRLLYGDGDDVIAVK
ncbi:hypothetical protein BC831DRAFT_510486 [Entophlyctis helioformis]|nr:hypothetical protein BC831DRAFT_510486 [Entophlyctis helioformis]